MQPYLQDESAVYRREAKEGQDESGSSQGGLRGYVQGERRKEESRGSERSVTGAIERNGPVQSSPAVAHGRTALARCVVECTRRANVVDRSEERANVRAPVAEEGEHVGM